ncbi:N-formylglutamate amidohydrolase [Niveispirillum lacus]|uniref:N-formylglutamate amidohydrolase n=1 Tax=Niveispirillum lacus TaxID=1981099 RepID=A0A255YVQ6_9PROT|nr:N-formylglutamate amidohydrolase [Niveispirillum lacus]OYQ32510.1 N-formylglutamate amidohydrolase [Niveispirillum lacus]
MSLVIDDVVVRHDPVGPPVPLLFDSPHSGTRYPADFDFTCPFPLLRQAEDTHVDELFAMVPDLGATLLCALFPRSYIDVNRAPDDIDPVMLEGEWPAPVNPSSKSLAGMGLVRHLCRPGIPMYDGRLPVAVVQERIENYWRPYHDLLSETMDGIFSQFGAVYHINCHSMPSFVIGPERQSPDFVIGDRDGSTAERGFTRLVVDTLRSMGYTVRLNDPYKGVELVRRYSNPARGRHSLQLEIDRRLYMNEETLEIHAGFQVLRNDLIALVHVLRDYALARTAGLAAE